MEKRLSDLTVFTQLLSHKIMIPSRSADFTVIFATILLLKVPQTYCKKQGDLYADAGLTKSNSSGVRNSDCLVSVFRFTFPEPVQ